MSDEKLDYLRHSCAHLLAAAVVELWPHAKRTIGPAIENGFYYDFDFGDVKVSEDDFPKIEAKMLELVKTWKGFERKEVTKTEALKLYKDNEYKKELIEEFAKEGQKLTLYTSGKYTDLCRGGHCSYPDKELKFFDLLSVAGAYWRGSEENKMLTRIYGTCFPNREGLDDYLTRLAEAKKRDHRKLGRELDLFTFSDLVGKGLPLYTQKGALIRRLLNEYVESIQSKQGYMQVWTPQIARAELFKISGHYDKYKEHLFLVKSNYSEEELFLKPMNCPQHTQIYAGRPRSYRDLPIRMTDFAMLYRDEKPGELNGLARVRSFSQDDCHIFCREDQVDEEVDRALAMIKQVMATFGFTYRYRLSTSDKNHPEKYVGDPKIWVKVEKWAEKIMQRNHIDYYDAPGEAAFYAPKMDLMATDALGREWQLSTVQIDYFMPERFKLTYADRDGKEKRPIMIHRAIIGSPERFLMVLLEHYNGAFPVWLAPVQVTLIPIAERHVAAARKMAEVLTNRGIRVEIDEKSEPMGAKIRNATLQKVPYMGIIGDKEVTEERISVRTRKGEDLKAMSLENFLSLLQEAIEHTV
jgi:threonyl-tRNA synthetase